MVDSVYNRALCAVRNGADAAQVVFALTHEKALEASDSVRPLLPSTASDEAAAIAKSLAVG